MAFAMYVNTPCSFNITFLHSLSRLYGSIIVDLLTELEVVNLKHVTQLSNKVLRET